MLGGRTKPSRLADMRKRSVPSRGRSGLSPAAGPSWWHLRPERSRRWRGGSAFRRVDGCRSGSSVDAAGQEKGGPNTPGRLEMEEPPWGHEAARPYRGNYATRRGQAVWPRPFTVPNIPPRHLFAAPQTGDRDTIHCLCLTNNLGDFHASSNRVLPEMKLRAPCSPCEGQAPGPRNRGRRVGGR